MVDPNAN
jgi:hypothetical protein